MLREHGHVAEHVTDIGPSNATDLALWRFALDNAAVIVTKDEDFANMLAMGGDTPAVVWVRVGNTRSTPLLAWFEPLIDQIVSKVSDGEWLIELR